MESASPDGHSRAESEERESETPLGATRRRAATGPVQFTFFRKQKEKWRWMEETLWHVTFSR